ncbi:MAG: GTP-binding protein [Oscillospiraceae bacterium]|nr:GTP-binding protein [Oscillospiraceae bacterium]
MTKIDIFSGFLGAGKTTLIKKLISEAYAGEKLVLVENEFGEIGIDGGFMQDAGINVTEMNSGCICCSLTGDFRAALTEVRRQYAPDRIIIEPSGVGKLSDVVAAVESCEDSELVINALVTVVDAAKAKMYMKNFGEFYNNQIASAGCIVLSRTQNLSEEKLEKALSLIREQNSGAVVITTPWDSLSGRQILEAMEQKDTLSAALEAMELDHEEEECDDPDCDCHHHHDDDDGEEEHHHHHHHGEHGECDDPDCDCHHHHDDDGDDDGEDGHEHHHHHHHHHGHDADEVFVSWGMETARKFTAAELEEKLSALNDSEVYGTVLRAKGIVDGADGSWLHFDYTPGESDIRTGSAAVTGRLCVIGSQLKEEAVAALFR